MNANAGHILVPSDPFAMQLMDDVAYSRQQKAWKRPWVYGGQQKLPGRHLVIQNRAFHNEKGELMEFTPLQVACFALQKAKDNGFDVITVETPSYTEASGNKALARCQFKVEHLVKLDQSDPSFFPDVKKGVITLEAEAVMVLPPRWTITESNLFVPTT